MRDTLTIEEAERVLGSREVGARLAAGPWRQIDRERVAVPAVAYLSLAPFGEVVIAPDKGHGWRVERAERPRVESEQEAMFAAEGAGLS